MVVSEQDEKGRTLLNNVVESFSVLVLPLCFNVYMATLVVREIQSVFCRFVSGCSTLASSVVSMIL